MNTITQQPHISASSIFPKSSIHPKSIFSSKTFWGIVFTTVAAIAPIVGESVDAGKLKGSNIAQITVILCGTGATLMGRVGAGNIYTPDQMPGPNKADMD